MNFKVVVPARFGSKRFPGKNKARLSGVPLINYSIQYAIDSGIDRNDIWINTDDPEILEIASTFEVNFYDRPGYLAGDLTSTVDVLKDQVAFWEKENIAVDAIVLLQVTNPLRPPKLLQEGIAVYLREKRSSLVTFSQLNKKFGSIENNLFKPRNYLPGQRMQDIEPLFYENGLLYISSVDLVKNGFVVGQDAYPMVIEHVFAQVDIDYPDDLIFAEAILKTHINNGI
ncbi:acylneuraminate cytidylyltransferase family protein [Algoriphagus sp. NG3]|uniref:acylneuraminate cytidylyltransferase family protein n=1 Tax=Algoriphagus sp. NG3 TaxID=3097546 RepID=UPI002A80AE2A|nr:acylneuraminate cytidylyltransferase family protein [Algoriphagus sp. NG3]WPR77801.1 acylneuraminate cytidylyltransferase family protein [Algoriphagus sp. NG3]